MFYMKNTTKTIHIFLKKKTTAKHSMEEKLMEEVRNQTTPVQHMLHALPDLPLPWTQQSSPETK